MKTLNIGILAHVDAGKTSLTERLLFESGVIDHIGSVDKGSTQTDSMDLERQRGITIQSAVVSFTVGDLKINLVDTPGHSDFISEVERALRVLDSAVLVVSSVEGVQAQTRVLMRTLTKLGLPVLIFANKIDRMGARYSELLSVIRERLTPHVIAMSSVSDIGTPEARITPFATVGPDFVNRLAELLAENSDSFLASYLDSTVELTEADYRKELIRQIRHAQVCPVFFGSAITGEGVGELVRGIREFLPSVEPTGQGRLRATVFKIERGRAGEKIAYVRVHSGTLNPRSHVSFYRRDRVGNLVERGGKVTAVRVFDEGASTKAASAVAGTIAKVSGLKDIQIGDQLGSPEELPKRGLFAPPSLETVVRSTHPHSAPALYTALQRLAEQDPFINTCRDDSTQEISVRLYGEVQKEVIRDTLAATFGLDVMFEETRTIYVEKPLGVGEALEEIDMNGHNYFFATVGLRVEPSAPGAGVTFRRSVELGALPAAFHKAIEDTVRRTLQQGIYGWEVIDCAVTLTHTGYASPVSAAGDFRKVTPLVVMSALKEAGTRVFEPINHFELETPVNSISAVLAKLTEVGATPDEPSLRGSTCLLQGTMPASKVHEFEQQLPALTQGEGVFLSKFHGYKPFTGPIPSRKRTDDNPLDRKEYLLHALNRV